MLRTEESRVSLVILFTFALVLLAGVYEAYVLWLTVIVMIAIIALWAYSMLIKKTFGERQDERSAKLSLVASRNGFICAVVLIALAAVSVRLGLAIDVISMTEMVWELSVAVYFLSYLYYKRVM